MLLGDPLLAERGTCLAGLDVLLLAGLRRRQDAGRFELPDDGLDEGAVDRAPVFAVPEEQHRVRDDVDLPRKPAAGMSDQISGRNREDERRTNRRLFQAMVDIGRGLAGVEAAQVVAYGDALA